MRAVIQRVSSASVTVNGGAPRPIGPGLAILLGVKDGEDTAIIPKLAAKCANLRIFEDDAGKLKPQRRRAGALGARRVQLHALRRHFARQPPQLHPPPPKAKRPTPPMKLFLKELSAQGLRQVAHGEFGADMQLTLTNDGPVTIVIDTDDWAKK